MRVEMLIDAFDAVMWVPTAPQEMRARERCIPRCKHADWPSLNPARKAVCPRPAHENTLLRQIPKRSQCSDLPRGIRTRSLPTSRSSQPKLRLHPCTPWAAAPSSSARRPACADTILGPCRSSKALALPAAATPPSLMGCNARSHAGERNNNSCYDEQGHYEPTTAATTSSTSAVDSG